MKNKRSTRHDPSVVALETRSAGSQAEQDVKRTVIEVERSGDWMPVEELREAALAVLEGGKDATLNLEQLNYLDASALQILLALDTEQKRRGGRLDLMNASPRLLQWFEYAGADQIFFDPGAERL
jgi:anti-anti-sigma factor